mgnify:CR=1 FL=1
MSSSLGDVLNIQDLKVRYPNSRKWVLNGFNLNISAGERLALIGSSGSGKSTVAKALMQILPSGSRCEGQLLLVGKELLNLNDLELEKARGELLGLVFQDPMTRLNPLMTIGDHLLDTLKAHNSRQTSLSLRARAEELLEKVGLNPARFDAYPHEFSGGMRQRVAIALAIALNPPLIIADEPTSSLDVAVANQVMSELSRLCDELGSSLLLISHDLALASRWCQRMAIIQEGAVIEEGYTNDVLGSPKSFLGKRLVAAAKAIEAKAENETSNSEVILEVDRLRCWYSVGNMPWEVNWIKAINEVSFSLRFGETLGLVGVSGCGKSTLSRALLGLLPIRGGEVKLLGKTLINSTKKFNQKSKQLMQMVFQDPFASLNPKMTVLEIVSDPILIHQLSTYAKAKEKTRRLIEQVGLMPPEDFLNRMPNQLSGGQQQRVAIARALALNPKVLICDESVSMLDAEVQGEILTLLRSLQRKLGLAILFITHDLSVAHSFCERIIVLDQGKIIEEGLANQVFTKPASPVSRKLVRACPRITT